MQKLGRNLVEAEGTIKKCKYSSITGRFDAPPVILENYDYKKKDMYIEKNRKTLFWQNFHKQNRQVDNDNSSDSDGADASINKVYKEIYCISRKKLVKTVKKDLFLINK